MGREEQSVNSQGPKPSHICVPFTPIACPHFILCSAHPSQGLAGRIKVQKRSRLTGDAPKSAIVTCPHSDTKILTQARKSVSSQISYLDLYQRRAYAQ